MTDLRRLGASHLHTPKLCLGGNVFGWTADKATSFAVLDAFVDAGGTLVDTAASYAHGDAERILGALIADVVPRSELLIASKAGLRWDGETFNDENKLFSPRVGLAWKLPGDTVIRAG